MRCPTEFVVFPVYFVWCSIVHLWQVLCMFTRIVSKMFPNCWFILERPKYPRGLLFGVLLLSAWHWHTGIDVPLEFQNKGSLKDDDWCCHFALVILDLWSMILYVDPDRASPRHKWTKRLVGAPWPGPKNGWSLFIFLIFCQVISHFNHMLWRKRPTPRSVSHFVLYNFEC